MRQRGMEQVVRKISRELKSIFDKYRHKKVYVECDFRISDLRWGSKMLPNKIWWRFFYEMKNKSTMQISLDYDVSSGKYSISGEMIEPGKRMPHIITLEESEAYQTIEQRIKEIPKNIREFSSIFERTETSEKKARL
jgi:hypothetical protein